MVELRPRLVTTTAPASPDGAVLLLHGGAARRGTMRVSPTQLSVLRMVPIAARVALAARGRLVVQRLLNSRRGWDAHHTPVRDVEWALAQLADRYGADLPVCLVGHSLGGRAALLAGGSPAVRSVVALAPWLYPREEQVGLRGKQVLFVHGDGDRVASPSRSAGLARDLERAADVGYVTVCGGSHAMLRRHSVFDGAAADYASATLLGTKVGGPVARVLSGDRWFEV
jgi:pimeloyl-ACP methyl ester carboxylesterase